MKHALPLFALLLPLVPLGATAREEVRATYQESKAHNRSASEGDKKKPSAPAKDATAARLKALEAENKHLREELTRKTGEAAAPGSEAASPEGALTELKAGNSRFVAGLRTRSQMGYNDAALRATLTQGQSPFAVIVTCSDSRLGDSFIFDQELGRLFTVREAGNCPDTQSLASIEYAAEHLGSKVVVVLGHESCGAVKAVMEAGSTPMPGHLWSLQAAMAGLLESVRHPASEPAAQHLSHLVEANAVRQARAVYSRSDIVRHLCEAGKLRVVPAIYDLASGRVRFLPAIVAEAPKPEAHH